MKLAAFIFVLLFIIFVLFCCLRVAARCDKTIDDTEQEKFIREHSDH